MESLSKEIIISVLLLTQLPIVYGAIHLIAWSIEYASCIEEGFWKIAAFMTLGGFYISTVLSGFRFFFF